MSFLNTEKFMCSVKFKADQIKYVLIKPLDSYQTLIFSVITEVYALFSRSDCCCQVMHPV